MLAWAKISFVIADTSFDMWHAQLGNVAHVKFDATLMVWVKVDEKRKQPPLRANFCLTSRMVVDALTLVV